jgi:uncharacterized protein YjbJ (UPF0337 family)
MVGDAANRAKDLASDAAGKAKDMAGGVATRAKELAGDAAGKAKDTAAYVGQKAEDATSAVGCGMKSLAGTIRDNAPADGPLGSASAAVADTLESGGRYLQDHGLSGLGEDMTNLIKRNPIPALLVGIGIGFLIARATTRSQLS